MSADIQNVSYSILLPNAAIPETVETACLADMPRNSCRRHLSTSAAVSAGDQGESLRLCREGLQAVSGAAESPGLARLLHDASRSYILSALLDEARPLCRQRLDGGHVEVIVVVVRDQHRVELWQPKTPA